MSKISFYFIPFFIILASNTFSQTDTITILHVNDSHSTLAAIGPRDQDLNGTLGGIARATSVIGYERTLEPELLLLHAGDISIGDLFFNMYFQAPELNWMNMMNFDAMELGNHDFDLTPAALLGSLQNVFPNPNDAFPILGANVDASAVPELDAYISNYITKDIGTIKIGIFGLITPSTNTTGFRCYRRSMLERWDFTRLKASGYAFQIETTYRVRRAGLRVREVRITFVERRAGASKMTGSIVAEAIWKVPLPRLQALTGRLS